MPEERSAVLFDFDHTLAHLGHRVDWESARRDLGDVYLAAGIASPELDAMPGAVTLYRLVGKSGLLPAAELAEAQRQASSVLKRYEVLAAAEIELIPGVADCVHQLVDAGVSLGIVSSNSAGVVRAILERTQLNDGFQTIVGRDDIEQPKPDPAGIILCCREMAVTPARALYVGDMATDVAAAIAAGAIPVGLLGGESSREALLEAKAAAVFERLDAEVLLGMLPRG